MVAGHRDAGGVDLGEAGVREPRAALPGPEEGAHVGGAGVRGQVEHVPVAAGGEDHRVAREGADLAGDEVPGHEARRPPAREHEVEHLRAREDPHLAGGDLAAHGGIGAEEQLLAGLAAGVEGPGDLGAAEAPVAEQPAVVAGERHALGHALVDDGVADLGEAVHVRLPRPVVPALDRVVEEPPDAVAVVRVVLGRVDPPLGGDAVRAPGASR